MKKFVLFLSLCSILVFGVNAQSLTLFDLEGNEVLNGQEFELVDVPSVGEITFHLKVQNSTENDLNVLAKKVYVDVVDLTMNMFCWGQCFGPDTYVSPTAVTILAGETTGDEFFSGHYMPLGHEGTSIIRYVFFNADNVNDSTYVTVKYVGGFTGINTPEDNFTVSGIYPNPATSVANIDYSFADGSNDATIYVNDLTGSRVKEITLSGFSGTASFDVSDLRNGIYFYTIVRNDEILITSKLIIK